MRYCLFFVAVMMVFRNVDAQNQRSPSIRFSHLWKNEQLFLDRPYSTGSDTITVSKLKYYVSNFQLFKGQKLVWSEPNSYHLIDGSNKSGPEIKLNISDTMKYDHLVFIFGVDSLTQSGGVKGGDLDPTRGMYWSWQSGYIHLKLEGTCTTCHAADKEFQFHIGGYTYPFNTIRRLSWPVSPGKNIEFSIDIEELLTKKLLPSAFHIMSPSVKAVAASHSIHFLKTEK